MKTLLFVIVSCAVAFSSPCQSLARDWQTYENSRFGFQFNYPSSVFHPGEGAANNDGQQFYGSDDQAIIIAFGRYNVLELTPKAYLDSVKSDSNLIERVTYERVARDWVVISGFVGQDVYYEKTIFSCSGEVLNSLVLVYSADLKPKIDPLVGPITKSLTPGVGYGTPEDCQ